MVKATTKTQRRIVKKLSRQQQQQSAADVASVALPEGELPPQHLETKREALLRKTVLASSSSTGAPHAAASDDNNNANDDSKQSKLKKKKSAKKSTSSASAGGPATKSSVVLDQKDIPEGGDAGSVNDALRRSFMTQQQLSSAARRRAEHQRRAGMAAGADKLPRRRTAAQERMELAQEELALYDRVVAVPAFAADPFAAIQDHLGSTMDRLQPLTDDIGRIPRE